MNFNQKQLVVTGGSGLLGSQLQKLYPHAFYPTSKQFDVRKFEQMKSFLKGKKITTFFHAAAFTSPPKVDKEPIKALEVNIMGTANIVKLCIVYKIKLIYMSTDYVFKGDKGNYKEDDLVYPVNKYAWSKLGGECAVRMYNNSLIIRTSFGPVQFPYQQAFTDQFTSRQTVKEIARKIAMLINSPLTGTIHIGGERTSVYNYSVSLKSKKNIKPISVKDVNFNLPHDTSLNVTYFKKKFNY